MYLAEYVLVRNMYGVGGILRIRCSNRFQSNHSTDTSPMELLRSTTHSKVLHKNGEKIRGIFLDVLNVFVVVCGVRDVQFALLEMEDVGDDLDALKREIGYSKPVRS